MRMPTRASAPAIAVTVLGVLACAGFGELATPDEDLAVLRKRTTTGLIGGRDSTPAPEPPPEVFELVRYQAPLGQNVAYVTPPRPGAPGAGIVWIVGGFNWGIDEGAWNPGPRENDQSASGFRDAGIALMLPALRGASGNKGHSECFFGEVDDILAAADALAARPDVDPTRVYVGGHSTGGTLALLAAASAPDRFRGVVSFGPVTDPRNYMQCLPEDLAQVEYQVRAPVLFMDEIRSPTLIIEGEYGNSWDARDLTDAAGPAPVEGVIVGGLDHFEVLAPGIDVVAERIQSGGPAPGWQVSQAQILRRR